MFSSCSGLTSVTLPNTLTHIGSYTFSDCALTSLALPNTLTHIGHCAFCRCPLTSVTLPNSLTEIKQFAFCDCTELASIRLPTTLTRISNQAFRDCTALTSITLPHITTAGPGAFQGCTGLTSVICLLSVSRAAFAAFIAWAVGSSRNRANWQVRSHTYACAHAHRPCTHTQHTHSPSTDSSPE